VVDVADDREQWMMKMASRTKMDDDGEDEDEDIVVGDLFDRRCADFLVLVLRVCDCLLLVRLLLVLLLAEALAQARLAEFLRRFLLPELLGRDVVEAAAAAAVAAAVWGGFECEDDDDGWDVQEPLPVWTNVTGAAAADRTPFALTGRYIVIAGERWRDLSLVFVWISGLPWAILRCARFLQPMFFLLSGYGCALFFE